MKRDVAEAFVDLQAIHYAAYCSTLTLEQVAEIRSEDNNESKDKNHEEIIEFITNEDFSDFDNQPRIILVANDFKEETLAAVLWLRDSGIDITCVKLGAYKLDEQIVVTPDIIIPLPEAKEFMMQIVEKKQRTSTKTKQWDEKSFFRELEAVRGLDEVEIVRRIEEWANNKLPRFAFNKNPSYGVFWPCMRTNSNSYWPIGIRTDGKIEIIFQWLKTRPPFDDKKLLEELLTRINEIPDVSIPIERMNGRPTINITTLKDEKSMKTFLNTLDWVVNKITNPDMI